MEIERISNAWNIRSYIKLLKRWRTSFDKKPTIGDIALYLCCLSVLREQQLVLRFISVCSGNLATSFLCTYIHMPRNYWGKMSQLPGWAYRMPFLSEHKELSTFSHSPPLKVVSWKVSPFRHQLMTASWGLCYTSPLLLRKSVLTGPPLTPSSKLGRTRPSHQTTPSSVVL